MEDKQKICTMLLPVLQATRNLYNLIRLEYDRNKYGCDEVVIATFANGAQKVANVSLDSGTAMILDILRQIV